VLQRVWDVMSAAMPIPQPAAPRQYNKDNLDLPEFMIRNMFMFRPFF
jgi:hypothetical protein